MRNILNKNKFILTLFSGFISTMLTLPSIAQSSTDQFLGEWQAEWHLADHAPELDITENKSQHMTGKMKFLKEGLVEINAYGYSGCLFSSDTIQNELKWIVTKDTIKLYNEDEEFSLEYAIHNVSEQMIHLSLMGDIFVILKR